MTPGDDVSVGHDVPVDGRTRHYGDFYGVPGSAAALGTDERALLVVWGNCQAEALRIVLSDSPDLPFRTVRVPPVHELESTDIVHVENLVRRAAVIVTQPVRAGYRDLPIGGPDLADLAPSATVIVWPVIRYGGLYPFQVIARHPSQPSAVPAAVPYHDLRTVLAARDGRESFDEWDVDVTGERLREAARWSVEQLAARERRQCDIAISDILLDVGADAAHTINHPGNRVLLTLGRRILDALGASAPIPPTRELLGNIRAPLEQRVIDALAIDASARIAWDVDGSALTEEAVHRSQMQWYADHPEFIDAVLDRYVELIDILGLA
ncbi:WcbI family polysaccharide biosynthesis putative acetyltransferase [Gordonia sp. 'Campus']|uniref:WcbI family polysaccharide biosynthesis putative acetyltransferase n=1 Tax=Gordonia sp. 'Campus' TaxID=2915824 RepID=UPI001EE3D798|nr:WcbI family polysaccharide biosynthesis putative acetyltransferase [Gordonia sp. 'Campus']